MKKYKKIKNIVFIGETSLLKNCFYFFKKNLNNKKYKFFLISKLKLKGIKKIKINQLEKIKSIDFFFSVINKIIIKKKLLQKIKFGLNFHNALLPNYRGLYSSTFALLKNEKFYGATWHKIESGIDTGDIAFKKKFIIKKKYNSKDLDALSSFYGYELFKKNIYKIINKKINFKKNNYTKYSYYDSNTLIKNYNKGIIKKNYSLEKIYRFYKALNVVKNKKNFLFTPKIFIKKNYFQINNIIISKTKLKNNFLFKTFNNRFIYFKLQKIDENTGK